MKKKLVLVITSISLVIASSYFISGKMIQKHYYQNIAKFSSNNDIKVSVISYKRGWLHSTTQLEVHFQQQQPNAESIAPLHLTQRITHGPFVVFNSANGLKAKFTSALIETQIAEVPQLKLQTIADLNAEATTWLSLAPADTAKSTAVTWNKIAGEIKHDLKFANYKGLISCDNFKITDPNWNLNFNSLALHLDAGSQAQSYFNNNVLHIKKISYNAENTETLSFNNLSLTLNITQDISKQIGISLSANIPESKINDLNFINDKLVLQISNIDPKAWPQPSAASYVSIKTGLDFVQHLTSNPKTKLSLEVPKAFTENFISYFSFELYHNSLLGRMDKRDLATVRQDINKSVQNIIQSALKQKIFIDNGSTYNLNFG